MTALPAPLTPEQLAWRCDPATLDFETTAEVPPLDALFGQERGVEAIELALGLETDGYNLYVAGPVGTGRETAVRDQIAQSAAGKPAPPDWCYLHNFQDPARPFAVELAAGQGPTLARDLDEFVATCRREIPALFEREQYQQRRGELLQSIQRQREQLFEGLQTVAEKAGFALQETPVGIATIPLLSPGQPMTPEAFALLPDERQAALRAQGQQLQGVIGDFLIAVRRLDREAAEQLRTLDREVVNFAIGHRLDTLRARYAGVAPIVGHLDAIQADLLTNLDELRVPEGAQPPTPFAQRGAAYERYRANVLVTNQPDAGVPVVYEPNPTYYNLLGRIDYRASLASMATDFTLIKPGAFHRANGGYLLLKARDVLLNPFAWNVLERALRDRELRIENLGDQLSAIPTATLRPDPIPLRVKVVLIGDLATYQLLHQLDPDFQRLFRIKAHFGALLDRTPEAVQAYAAFVSRQARDSNLRPFDRAAVARVVEHGVRLAGHRVRMSACFEQIGEVLVEADFYARRDGTERVGAAHVDRALAARERRANLAEEESQRMIDDGTIAIDTHSEAIGQIHGLAVADLGDYVFARPARISARVGVGGEGIVNIEREVELSGPLHSKGVLTLSGYLLGQYAGDLPLALAARLTFEQTYGAIDGDSASCAELYALLSALAELPLRQGIAVTGAVNQRGEVQAIGEVTRKIEGFFAVCQAQGLTGEQGVLIPATNVQHLQLRDDVRDAVAAGRFHIWPVQHIDQGLELLSGVPAGERRADGTYAPDTIHGRVQRRLRELATHLADYGGARRHTARTRALATPGVNNHARGNRQ